MCRFGYYEGPVITVADLLYRPVHSLEEQSIVPREMLAGRINVDGTGVAWWAPGERDPLRYRTVSTTWGDPNLPELAPRLLAERLIVHVRSATPGIPVGASQVAPFIADGITFAHNGWLGGFRTGVGQELSRRLPPEQYRHLDAVSDSMTLFLTVLKHRAADPSAGLEGAVASAIEEAATVCADHGRESTMNIIAAEADATVVARHARDHAANSLYVAPNGTAALPSSRVVASEPLDDDAGWEPVATATMLLLEDGAITSIRL